MCPAGPAAVCFRASEQPTQVNPLADDRADHIRSGLGDPATVGHDHQVSACSSVSAAGRADDRVHAQAATAVKVVIAHLTRQPAPPVDPCVV